MHLLDTNLLFGPGALLGDSRIGHHSGVSIGNGSVHVVQCRFRKVPREGHAGMLGKDSTGETGQRYLTNILSKCICVFRNGDQLNEGALCPSSLTPVLQWGRPRMGYHEL
mmetsp:Transcript_3789/g.9680  ORF Transcript_3789/g.9680 Transcript_3789/m.9680 type:complete len:110 (+) Transcript_3789:494-823(+)